MYQKVYDTEVMFFFKGVITMTVSGMNSSSASTLFSSLSTSGNNNLFSSFSELSSIRQGSYGKLLNAYYDQTGAGVSKAKTTSGTDNTSRGYYEKYLKDKEAKIEKEKNKTGSGATEVTDTNSKVAGNANQMVSSIDKLSNKDTYKENAAGEVNTDAIMKEVKSYVDAYNSVIDASKKTDVSGVSSNVSSMTRVTSTYAKKLSEIGITLGEDKKLSLNEDAFKKADMSKVQETFGRASYGYSVRTNAYMANYYATQAQNNSSTYGSNAKTNFSDLMSSYSNYI